jgi:hypothetical protein
VKIIALGGGMNVFNGFEEKTRRRENDPELNVNGYSRKEEMKVKSENPLKDKTKKSCNEK